MKKIKKSLSLLLSVLMAMSLLTVNTFADDEGSVPATPLTPATSITPNDVADTLKDAAEAQGEVAKDSALRPDGLSEVDAAVAAANSLLAATIANEAEKDKVAADEKLSELATDAKDAAEAADAAKDDAHEARKDAQEAAKEAYKELQETKDETYRDEAQVQASEAKDAAEDAKEAATEAFFARNEALMNYEIAKEAYEEAVRVWTLREIEIKSELAAGLLTAIAAEQETKEALAKIKAYKNAMDGWAEKAEEAADAAKDVMEQAHSDLADAEKALASATVEAAKDTAVAAAAGAALLATKAVVGTAQTVVNYYEGEIDGLEDQTKKLKNQIETANEELEKLKKEIADAKVTKDKEAAKQAYEDAKDALELAKAELDRAEKILAAKNDAKLEAEIQNVSNKIIDGTVQNEDIVNLTNKVFDLKQDVKVEWNEEALDADKCVFSITDENGVKINYIAETKKDGSIQYYNAVVRAKRATLDDLKNTKLKDIFNPFAGDLSGDTGLIVIDENNNIKKVTIKREKFLLGKINRIYIGDEALSLSDFLDLQGLFEKIQFRVGSSEEWDRTDEKAVTNSDLTELFKDAQNNKDAKEAAKNEKVQATNDALTDLTNKQIAYDQATASKVSAMELQKSIIDHNTTAIEENADKINNLDKKLNGDLIDQIIRSAITGKDETGFPTFVYGETNILEYMKELREWYESKGITGSEYENAKENAENILTILNSAATGKVDLDTASAVIGLLSNAGLSEKTKLAIAEKIEELAQKEFDKAKAELETSAKAAADATAYVARADLAYTVAKAEEALAKAAAEDADKLFKEAQTAADLAETARKQYEFLLATYGPDYSLVIEARNAMLAAGADAAHANLDYLRAVAAARRAQKAYEEAQAIADAKPVRPVVGKPVVKTSVAY